jgi:hypothetical protein
MIFVRKFILLDSMAITRVTHNRDREKSAGQANLFKIRKNMSHGKNLSSTSGEPEFVAL